MKRVRFDVREHADERARSSGVYAPERKLSNGAVHRSWDESSIYVLTREDVDHLLDSVAAITSMMRDSVDFLLDGEWGTLGFSNNAFQSIRDSFDIGEPELFTRYDFAHLSDGGFKLVGVSGDGPEGFVETAHSQRVWLREVFGQRVDDRKVTQLNNLPELSRKAFEKLRKEGTHGGRKRLLHVLSDAGERGSGWLTSAYVKGLAQEAGWSVKAARVRGLRWGGNGWLDEDGSKVSAFYKQYPWDLLLGTLAGPDLIRHKHLLELSLEPMWKAVLNTRAVIPAMWHLFGDGSDGDILSPAFFEDKGSLGENHVSATLLPENGRNEMAHLKGRSFTSWGEDELDLGGHNSLVFRELVIPRRFRDASGGYRFPFVSVFTVGGQIAGVGIRETRLPLLGQHYTFKPHVVTL